VAGYSTAAHRPSADVQRLTSLYARGRLAEAENLARQIVAVDPRQPLPYAVLGDLARARGNRNEAAKLYAYAAQFDPANALYQRKYEELLNSSRVVSGKQDRTRLEAREQVMTAPIVGVAVMLTAGGFVALSPEEPIFDSLSLLSSWTIGLVFMLFLMGLAVGSSFAIGNLLDRFHSQSSTAVGRVGPAVVLGLVAVVNFWLAVAFYLLLGFSQRAFNYSTTRLVIGVGFGVFLMTLAAEFGTPNPLEVMLWGGNVVYLGALAGWVVADAFRR
jgi:tetratricopeptide (TPR) repeat protein